MKKTLLKVVSYVLVAAIAIGGTVAFLQDTDSDVNVMTLGNVSIAQHEYEREVDADGNYVTDSTYGYKLQDFTQSKPLYPATEVDANGNLYNFGAGGYGATRVKMSQVDSRGSMDVFVSKNAQDKFVTIENTGKSEAYVRTIIALEIGSLTAAKFKEVIKTSSFMIEQGVWKVTDVGIVEIEGNNYYVCEYLYEGGEHLGGVHKNGILPAKDTTYPSLAQVYMTGSATNEDCANIDGNQNGKYDILVLSQAIQTNGFATAKEGLDTGFGVANAANVQEWFKDVRTSNYITDAKDVEDVLNKGGNVKVEENVKTDSQITVEAGKEVDVDLQDKKLEGEAIVNNGDLTVSDGDLKADYIQNNGNATYEDVKMEAGTTGDYANITRGEDAVTVYENVDVTSYGGGIAIADGAKAVFESGKVYVTTASTSGRYVFYLVGAGSELVINDGEFGWDAAKNNKRAYIYADAGTKVTINGGTFGKASTRSGYTAGIMGTGTVEIKGGTFGFNPTQWVADGYEAVQSGSTWTVSAK